MHVNILLPLWYHLQLPQETQLEEQSVQMWDVLSLIAAKQWEKLRAVWYSERNIALLLNLKTSIA
jgi:hypothetical protein